ncbi:MAG: metalloregulator ArsR/SmtB family transcription factor [Pseudomonadota bacterium]
MEIKTAIEAFAALGHPGRLAVLRLLARRAPGGVRPTEMAEALEIKHSTLSVYLGALSRAGLVLSERDGKSIYYRLDLAGMSGLIEVLVADCCRGRPELCTPIAERFTNSRSKGHPIRVLFVSRGNSARSIFAEALLRVHGGDQFEVHSAGTAPKDALTPQARDLLKKLDYDLTNLVPKPVSGFQGGKAIVMDFVFTVCDRAANEDQQQWRGNPMIAHWSVPDPVSMQDERQRANGYLMAYQTLERRIAGLADLPIHEMSRLDLQHALDALGET